MGTEWYLKTGAKVLGPLSFEELIVLVRAGALAGDDLVRSSSHVAWQRAQSVPGLFPATMEIPPKSAWSETVTSALASVDARRRAAQCPRSLKVAGAAGDAFGRGGASFLRRAAIGLVRLLRSALFSAVDNVMYVGEKIWRSPALRIATLLGAVAAALVIGYAAIPARWLISTGVAWDIVDGIGRTLRDLQDRDASRSEWESFAEQNRRQLAMIVPILEQRASNDQAARELVWAARDCLPTMIATAADQHEQNNKIERRFENHLARAKKRIGLSPRQSYFDATTIGIVLIDIAIAVVLICIFRRR